MANPWLIVSYHTDHPLYNKAMSKLKASLDAFNLPHEITKVPHNDNNWINNIDFKAVVISKALKTHPDKNIIWVDADATFERWPHLFNKLNCDVGYYHCEFTGELISAVIFFSNTEKVRHLVSRWIEVNKTNQKMDQENLQVLIEGEFAGLNMTRFPDEYCKIHDSDYQKAENPVIKQWQISREYRDQLNTYNFEAEQNYISTLKNVTVRS